jgi:hypothetical protein
MAQAKLPSTADLYRMFPLIENGWHTNFLFFLTFFDWGAWP